jgi:hypothetical protein
VSVLSTSGPLRQAPPCQTLVIARGFQRELRPTSGVLTGLREPIRLVWESAGRTLLRSMTSAPRSGLIARDKPSEKGLATMKLTTITNVSVDGVMQGLGAPDEDRRGGFKRGGWAIPSFDDEAATFLTQVYQRADAFLFGRRTSRSSPAPGARYPK